MKNIKHPYDLDEPNHINKVTSRIAGFIGGSVAGLIIGLIGSVIATKFGAVSLDILFYGVLSAIIFFAIVGAIWPKWFVWILDVLTF